MRLTTQIEKVRHGLTDGIRNHTPVKILGALVPGAALVTVSATVWAAEQPEASNQPIQMALGEEWFHPVTGENNVGVAGFGLGDEYFHPVTGDSL